MNPPRVPVKYLVIALSMRIFGALAGSEPVWFSDLLNYIENNNESYRQVIIITCKNPGIPFENPWIRAILHAAMSTYPTIRINVDLSSDIEEEWSSHRTDSTATLFIFVDDRKKTRSIVPRRIISIMKKLSLSKKLVKYLVTFLSSTQTQNFDHLLRYAWRLQMMDLVILEVVSCRRDPLTILKRCVEDISPVIHHFNPFVGSIIRKTYHPGIEWFPDIMKDMHGYPLKIGIIHQPPFSDVSWDENWNYKSGSGWDITTMEILAEEMNFTLNILPRLLTFDEIVKDNSSRGLFDLLRTDKIDILASASPHFTEDMEENLFRSESLFREELCALVPLEKTTRIPFPAAIVEGIIMTIGIVVVFWGSAWLFQLPKSWSIFKTFRVLFAIPVHSNYSDFKMSQRLVVLILMIISLFYTANFYASLMKLSTEVDGEVEYGSFDELDRSGLDLKISTYLMNKTFGNVSESDGAMMNLKSRAVVTNAIWECPAEAERFRNVGCLMNQIEAKWFTTATYRRGQPTLKLSKVCFWKDSYAFLVRAGSPYRRRIDRLLNVLIEAGLKVMLYRNSTFSKLLKRDQEDELLEELDVPPEGVLREQLTDVLLFGFTTATVTFIGEFLWYRGGKILKKNK
ncbi:uncharacterized protein [Fopius arisanus]|uniref:Cmbl protein n=1 Tax=Fopius arisanus TaxID=64838 RepID=A0A0C9S175_9HYME|nr:PREDICTED: uncharacterized protein LOC105269722 [Fopius arisanus]